MLAQTAVTRYFEDLKPLAPFLNRYLSSGIKDFSVSSAL
jgi:hypothetical protein